MNTYSYLILRLVIAASMFGHGLVRLPKIATFSEWMVNSFKGSILPSVMVTSFSYALPIAEFAIGLLLLLGLFTKQAAFAGGIVMVILVFGATTVENWEIIPAQLIHAVFFATLIHFNANNSFAADNLINK